MFIIGYIGDLNSGSSRDIVANGVSSAIWLKGQILDYILIRTKSELITKTATPISLLPIYQFLHFTVNDASLLDLPSVIGTTMDTSIRIAPAQTWA